ncbi:hypothetical protein [Acidisphaera sp. L21]|uniref:hypothetical protein n=1 Tax=Acidisphaera sp. L21 TaxID=1641851 RepID=UPI00131C7092|nr:hypothetical protein [Acidisphaera sp. L21]
MRKTLLTLTALAGLIGAGAIGSASAAPVARLDTVPAASLVQPIQYYGGYHHREWRHRQWVRHHRWEERRWRHGHRW